MASPSKLPAYKRVPKWWAAIGYLVLLAMVLLLFLGRSVEVLRSGLILEVAPDFYTQVSNFAISYLLYAAIGYQWLMAGATIKPIIWLGMAILLCNFVYESFIPFINTPDPMDAMYGLVGTALGFLVLWVMDRHGLMANPALEKPAAAQTP
jgi:hypothetical protein